MRSSFWHAGRFVRDFAASALAPIVSGTEWRRNRLLILGYHGVAIQDEHLWDGTIFLSEENFRRRLQLLRDANCAVLPLESALRQLQEGTLPKRAVVLAFDDGFHDFSRMVAPVLKEFNYTATVFLSSYYAQFNRPIFDLMLRYLLWKGAGKTLTLPGVLVTPRRLDSNGQAKVRDQVQRFSFEAGLSGLAKDQLLERIAAELAIDYADLCEKRLLHMMNADEVRQMHLAGHDVQLHTHRHRVSRKKEYFDREITDNRRWISETLGGKELAHMSFPGDVWGPVERQWLTELGVESATTCRPALADRDSDPLLLPRFMDNDHVPERVFRAWVAGSMAFFPKSEYASSEGQIIEESFKVDLEDDPVLTSKR